MMQGQILGLSADSFYALMFLLLLIILGIVSFHYYVYVSGGNDAAFRAGTGVGITLLPGRAKQEQRF